MRTYFRLAVCVVAGSVLSGCVSIQPKALNAEQGDVLRGKSLVVDEYQTPSFSAATPGKAVFGLIGGLVMIGTGNAFVKENKIRDPAAYIGNKVADRLTAKYDMRVVRSDIEPLSDDAIDVISAKYPESDFVLDSQTINWSYAYYPVHWDSYRLMYSVRLRLIDTHTKSVLAEAFCARNPEYTDDAPSHSQLTDDGGEWVKRQLTVYADACGDELGSKVLGVNAETEKSVVK